jgi:hypothetical protein
MHSDTFFLTVLPAPQGSRSAQILAEYRGARVLEILPTGGPEGGAGRRWHAIVRMHERIRNYVDGKARATLPADDDLVAYGTLLFETLFPRDVKRLYDTARSHPGPSRLDVVFTSMIPWIADKPWEFAYDPVRKAFLATEEIHFARNVLTATPAEAMPTRPPPLRILVVTAQPVGQAALSVDDEIAVVRRGFEPLRKAGAVEIEVLPRATPADLHAGVSRGYDIVHFIGHGDYDPQAQEGHLLFEDGQGKPQALDARTLREILCRRGVRLLFLNACETARGGRSDFNRGVGPALLAGGLPAVVANQYKVLDVSATAFAQHFYRALAQGMTLAEAARESRIAVRYSIAGEAIDWAVPVLYARDPGGRMCEPGALAATLLPPAKPGAHRAAVRPAHRIGVWDINNTFPRLEETLGRLNEAQDRFGFQRADLSAPLGTWRVRAVRGRQRAYLRADRLSRALAHRAEDLAVDSLVGITDQPLIGHLDAGRRQALTLFSTAGLGVPAGETHRVLANAVVRGLARQLAALETHTRPPRTCPLFHDPGRKQQSFVGPLRFDATCRARLLRALAAEDGAAAARGRIAALERLLTTFHP